MGKVIGIDLGTTNSCVAVMEGGEPTVIVNAEGDRTTPSVVAFSKKGERLVGAVAKRQAATNVDRTIASIKREMGTAYRKKIDGKSYTPQEISAYILMKLKKDAESYLGETVSEAVITVPAYFNDAQRQATKDAGRIAGLNVLRIINEPTSAALAYGLDNGAPQKIMVYDLGGGTFDVSLIEIGEGLIEVLATAGDNHLGGDDFDECLTNYIVEEYRKKEKINLAKDPVAFHRVREAAEEAKKTLSSQTIVNINLPFITTVHGEPKHLDMDVSRAVFDDLTRSLVDRTEIPVRKVLDDAGVSTAQLGMVLLVGGSTRIQAVQEKVRRLTGKEPSRNLNPDECVALGAAVQGAKLGGLVTTGAAADLILMDILMPDGENGLETAARIKAIRPWIRIIAVTSMAEASWLKRAREIGIESFWYKESSKETILEVMDCTMNGDSVYPDQPPKVKLGLSSNTEFTQRELEVLRLMTRGMSNSSIAGELGISENTVKSHIQHMLDKTGYKNRTELAIEARIRGIVVSIP